MSESLQEGNGMKHLNELGRGMLKGLDTLEHRYKDNAIFGFSWDTCPLCQTISHYTDHQSGAIISDCRKYCIWSLSTDKLCHCITDYGDVWAWRKLRIGRGIYSIGVMRKFILDEETCPEVYKTK